MAIILAVVTANVVKAIYQCSIFVMESLFGFITCRKRDQNQSNYSNQSLSQMETIDSNQSELEVITEVST